jgi:RNA polymerase sigma-70 factor (ECF subfamily)
MESPTALKQTVPGSQEPSAAGGLTAIQLDKPISPLTQLFRSQYRQLVRFCRIRVQDRADAEDIVQAAFLNARRAYPDKGIEELRPLLFTLVRNGALDFLRSGEHRRRQASVEIGEAAGLIACDLSPTPEQQLMDADRLKTAQKIIDGMAPHRRDALLLHRIEGLTYAEIEKRLSMSRTGVIVAIAEAVAELAEGLARAEGRRLPPGR